MNPSVYAIFFIPISYLVKAGLENGFEKPRFFKGFLKKKPKNFQKSKF